MGLIVILVLIIVPIAVYWPVRDEEDQDHADGGL